MGAAAGVVVGGIGSELSGGTFSQGAMLAAMNAVTVWAIEQSTASGVKTGGESMEKAQIDITIDQELFAGPGAPQPYYFYAGGTWTENVCFDASLGQNVKIYVKNVNVLGTTISIKPNIGPTQQQILLPQKQYVFKFQRFGPEPLHWKFCVSTYSKAFAVLYEIRSTWVPGMPENY